MLSNGCGRCGGTVTVVEDLQPFVGGDESVPILRSVVCESCGPLEPHEFPEGVL